MLMPMLMPMLRLKSARSAAAAASSPAASAFAFSSVLKKRRLDGALRCVSTAAATTMTTTTTTMRPYSSSSSYRSSTAKTTVYAVGCTYALHRFRCCKRYYYSSSNNATTRWDGEESVNKPGTGARARARARNQREYGHEEEKDKEDEAVRRRRRTEWKRRQGGQSFLDHFIVNVRGGNGGNGCAAFHREKFVPFGPPSGGNGGRGGDVYLLPTPHLTSLASIPKRIRGNPGGHGQGSWLNGKAGEPLVIKVPLGTVVKEVPRGDTRRAKDEWEAEEEALQGLTPAERQAKMREHRWVHFPRAGGDNVERDSFKDAEATLYKQERERRLLRKKRSLQQPLDLDLDTVEIHQLPDDAPLGARIQEPLGHLVASGGLGGLGNPHFLTAENRSPKFATRGHEGERITLSLELKLLADVGLVGMPNAGKSTLLRALTGGRVKSEVAGYAFTTLNPIVGVIRIADDGTFEGGIQQGLVHDETAVEERMEQEQMANGAYANALTRNQQSNADGDHVGPGHQFDLVETFRFTIADNPGLISRASENVGLGHSFLRSMERSLALAYVVDLSGPAPWDELAILQRELEAYQTGMSTRARIVIANKADLLAAGADPVAVEEARAKLQRLERFVRTEMNLVFRADTAPTDEPTPPPLLDVVAVSAKYSQNLNRVVSLMRKYIEEARE